MHLQRDVRRRFRMGILTHRKYPEGQRPLSPTSLRLQGGFFLRGVLPRRAVVQHGRSAHSPRADASCAEKVKKKVRTGLPDRVFVMKNQAFVEFISKIRAACLFLHIANKKLIPMRIKFRTSRPMQTPRDISYTGNPTGGTTAYPAVLPAAHEATENPDNIFYRTIRTAMKNNLYIYWHRRACWPPDAPRKTTRKRRDTAPCPLAARPTRRSTRLRPRLQARPKRPQPGLSRSR